MVCFLGVAVNFKLRGDAVSDDDERAAAVNGVGRVDIFMLAEVEVVEVMVTGESCAGKDIWWDDVLLVSLYDREP